MLLLQVFLSSLLLPSCFTYSVTDDFCDEHEIGQINGVDEIDQFTVDQSVRDERDVFRRMKREFVPYKTGKLVARQVSNALDHLLFKSGYDKRIRPLLGGPPIPVIVNLSIRSMGPVDESIHAFSLDCYFRQSWVDPRLKYNATGVTELALNWAFLAKIWVPDTFIVNGKKSFLHKITVPNRFVRISPNGRVSYSQRLTIWASCPMNLQKFPLDSQVCPLQIGSFGYSAEDIIYKWAKPTAVSIDEVGMAQFLLKDYKSFENIAVSNRRTKYSFRNDSTATLEFLFERQTGFFLLQIYTPLTLIVFCSWVAFWLIKTEKGGEVPARTALGATSVLSVVNIGFGGKSRPQVGYATAMDTFIILCFIAVFAALVEFSCINFIDTYFKRLREKNEAAKKAKEEAEAKALSELMEKAILGHATSLPIAIVTLTSEDDPDKEKLTSGSNQVRVMESSENETTKERLVLVTIQSENSQPDTIFTSSMPPLAEIENGEEDRDFEDLPDDTDSKVTKSFYQTASEVVSEAMQKLGDKFESFCESRWGPMSETYVYQNTTEVVWSIDEQSRKCFPLVFLVLQIIYWTSYLYII